MNIRYDNSMFTSNPPSIILAEVTPQEVENAKIRAYLDEEEHYFKSEPISELNNYGKSKRIR